MLLDYREFQGIKVPTGRRIVAQGPESLLVSTDVARVIVALGSAKSQVQILSPDH
jgi:hypothetical protein